MVVKCMYGCCDSMNIRVLGNGLELLSANGRRFEKNQPLFADGEVLVVDSK